MNSSKSEHRVEAGNLRNFDLTVDEIRLARTINNMTSMVEKIERLEPTSPRVRIIRNDIRRLQQKLEQIRDNTLIQ